MKLSMLKEFRKAPLGMLFSKEIVFNLISDEDNSEMMRTHLSVDGKDFVIICYSFDNSNKLFALVNRLDHSEIAGYLIIKKFSIGWQVQDTAIYPKFRNKGLGIDLFVKVIQSGISLISGFSLSNEAEKLWMQKLPKFVNVQVLSKSDSAIHPFSNEPQLDRGSDLDQNWFFIATSKNARLTGLDENYTEDGLGNLLYENWLLNRGTPVQSYRSSKFGDDGDF